MDIVPFVLHASLRVRWGHAVILRAATQSIDARPGDDLAASIARCSALALEVILAALIRLSLKPADAPPAGFYVGARRLCLDEHGKQQNRQREPTCWHGG